MCRFLRFTAIVQHMWSLQEYWRANKKATGVIRGCPASGFLIAMAFDPIFCWLQDAIIPRNRAAPDFFQLVPCAYADDFALAASSFRLLMAALCLTFWVVGHIDGLNLTHRKCWVQYGSERRCREKEKVRFERYDGTGISPEVRAHRWTAPRNNHTANQKNHASSRVCWRDCVILRCVPSAPDVATLRDDAHALQMHYCRPIQYHSTQITTCWLCAVLKQRRGPVYNGFQLGHTRQRPGENSSIS